jgi:hypothetical protein
MKGITMVSIIKQRVVLFLAALSMIIGFASLPVPVYAAEEPVKVDIGGSLEDGSCVNDPDCDIDDGKKKVNATITNIINIFSMIVGIVAVIMLIYGGFRYVTSGGDSGAITSAKNTILYAIVGLVIVAISQAIVQFVLGSV